ncbi:MAG: ATP-binding protein [Thermoleophilia bacterium]|nr:ATP-binding protein [Thermoleophilia bacterium]
MSGSVRVVEVSEAGQIARVVSIDPAADTIGVVFPNNAYATATGVITSALFVGAVLLLRGSNAQLLDESYWPNKRALAVVKERRDTITLLETPNSIVQVPTTTIEYEAGNTVEYDDHLGVRSVISDVPIRPSLRDDEPVSIERFRFDLSDFHETFDDFEGMPSIVARARELIELPLSKADKLKTINARPIKGVLFTGTPGTGKTMLARIVAKASEAAIYEIRGPELFNKWVGQSEEVLRRIFEHAAKQPRSIIFFDEIDSVASKRDDNSHEMSKRMVTQLLTLMDGFKKDDNVLVVATTNRPDDLDPALLRPGRFDWSIHFPPPGLAGREAILRRQAGKLSVEEPLPHRYVAERTEGWSGADLGLVWREAALLAAADDRDMIMTEDYLGGLGRGLARRSPIETASMGGR